MKHGKSKVQKDLETVDETLDELSKHASASYAVTFFIGIDVCHELSGRFSKDSRLGRYFGRYSVTHIDIRDPSPHPPHRSQPTPAPPYLCPNP